MKHNVIGMDIAKNVFQVHAVDARSGEIERIKLRRNEVIQFFTNRDRSLVAMEACGGALVGSTACSNGARGSSLASKGSSPVCPT